MRREFISYPKSGRSRIRFGLNHLGLDSEIRFQHDEFEFNDGAKPPHNFSVESRLVKYAGVDKLVFLKRDPRDVIVSLFHQVTGRFKDFFNYEGDISAFIRDPYFGAEVLHRFYQTWDEVARQRDVLIVHYEDCATDAAGVFERIGTYYGFDLPHESWVSAAEASTFERMKAIEESGTFPGKWLQKRQGHAKVRKGKVGGYAEALNESDIAYVNSVFGLV